MRRLGVIAANLLESLMGRRNLVRGSRFLLDFARRDVPNDMITNGEWLVQDAVLATMQSASLTAFDVGAHVGEWTLRLLAAADQVGIVASVHAFEPSRATFERLTQNLLPTFGASVVLVPHAASDHDGAATLFKAHELAGSNSLHEVELSRDKMTRETVRLCTLDAYCKSVGVRTIDLLKVDAEGHDCIVLGGAEELLERGAIEVIQFEYNHRWIRARRFLKDVFDYLQPFGYEIGKVTPGGIEWYREWGEELETFREGNYLAVRSHSRRRLPSVTWWMEL